MHKKAFTLIEVMVVLSILAIIAILAYNFFGSTMKEATLKQKATKLYKEMMVVSEAVQKYHLDNPDSTLQGAAMEAALVNGGYLKSHPTIEPGSVDQSVGDNDIWLWLALEDMGGPTAAADDVIDAYSVTEEVCQEVNRIYGKANAYSGDEWNWTQSGGEPTKYPTDAPVWCLNWGTDWSVHVPYVRR